MKILALDVNNVKRISAAHIEPDGSVVILGGDNEQGKTSLLDAITMTLGGGKNIPGVPLRRGAKKGSSRIDMGDVVITRTFTEGGGGQLAVEAKVDGTTARVQSPQGWLDARIGALSFDPLTFMRDRPSDQAETLRKLVGVDTAGLDTERAKVFSNRTDINRQVRDAEGAARDLPHYPDAPDEVISIVDLTAKLEKALTSQTARDSAAEAVTDADGLVSDYETEVADCRQEFEQAKASLAEAEACLAKAKDGAKDARTKLAAAEEVLIDDEPIREALQPAEETNDQVRANRKRDEALANADKLRDQAQKLTDRLAEIDSEKAGMLAKADFPVPDLSFGDDGLVTYKGLPLDQASGAEKIRVSMAVALAMNPNMRIVLIRDASLLDAKSLQMVAEMAAERDAQVWLERVGDGDPGAVIIEDGSVRGAEIQNTDGEML